MRKKVLLAVLLTFSTLAVILYEIGSLLIMPVQHRVDRNFSDLKVEDVSFRSGSGSLIKGWFLNGTKNSGIVLMHGVRGDRNAMLTRAQVLNAQGYSVLLFDFQAHGESTGDHITFGFLESRDAKAAVKFMREQKHIAHVGALGQSMGAASIILADGANADAIELESSYTDIHDAIVSRLRIVLGNFGGYCAPLLEYQLKWRLGIDPSDLSPLKHISHIHVPLLIIAGDKDMRAPLPQSIQLFNAANEPKSFWVIKDAGHQDFMNLPGDEYKEHMLAFFAANLPQ